MKYFIGVIAVGIGFLLVWKADWLMNNFGRIAWAEEHLGTEGGTRMLFKIIGILVIIGAFMVMTGAMGAILGAIFKPSTQAL